MIQCLRCLPDRGISEYADDFLSHDKALKKIIKNWSWLLKIIRQSLLVRNFIDRKSSYLNLFFPEGEQR